MRLKEIAKASLLSFAMLLVSLVIFRSLIINFATSLIDLSDYPLVVWISNTVSNFNQGNIFYPNRSSIFFADLLVPTSMLFKFFHLFFPSIFSFNIVFFLTIFLNAFSAYYFWKQVIKKFSLQVFAVLATTFSPFVFLQLSHFQMLVFWPLLFGLSLLFQKRAYEQKVLAAGILNAVQFSASVYLGTMMVMVSLTFLIFQRKSFQFFLIYLASFIALSFPLLFSYLVVKTQHKVTYQQGEFVDYAAHISDYAFSNKLVTSFSTLRIIKDWNNLNNHVKGEYGAFPGAVLAGLGILGIYLSSKKRDTMFFFFFALVIAGFIFSLGPRFNFNGKYLQQPLPYYPALKLVPPFKYMRATARWNFLLYFGLIYFTLKSIEYLFRKSQKEFVIVLIVSAIFLLETVPVRFSAQQYQYPEEEYRAIQNLCKQDNAGVLLEYPIFRYVDETHIQLIPSYSSIIMLNSVYHGCKLVNGYSGFIPQDIKEYEREMDLAIKQRNLEHIRKLLQQKDVRIIKVNMDRKQSDVFFEHPSLELVNSSTNIQVFAVK